MRPEHWLIVRGGALGDFVLTTPVIRTLRTRSKRLSIACCPRYAAPFDLNADDVLDIRSADALWLFGSGMPSDALPDAAPRPRHCRRDRCEGDNGADDRPAQ